MGTDIRLHQEVKINGKWEHYREAGVPRNYRLFGKMAGVRGDETPLAEPRGLPDDAAVMTRFCYDHDPGYTPSWLNAEEVYRLDEWLQGTLPEDKKWRVEVDFWGYFFGNTWGGFFEYPDDGPEGVEDIRFVFWFD